MGENEHNIVMVTADSLRADHCGFIDAGTDLTPNLTALAEDGTVFESAVSPGPRTPTSVPEMLTGEILPHGAPGSYSEYVSRFANHLKRHQTLPERLSELGYTTVAFSANPWTSTRCGVDEIFDEFYDVATTDPNVVEDVANSLAAGTAVPTLGDWFAQWRQRRGFFSQWPTFFDEVRETLRRVPEPYFVWIFLLDTHNPYLVPRRDRVESSTVGMYYGLIRGNALITHDSEFSNFGSELPSSVETRIRRAYRDTVRSVDRFALELLTVVDGTDTVVVINSDHGEAFNEHGTYGHQQALYEENVHVPLLVRGPDGDDGQSISRPISLRTLPQLLEAYARDSASVRPEEWTEPSVIARSEGGSKIAVRTEDRKYIRTGDGAELYDLTDDPGERRNIVNEADVTRFKNRIEEYLEQVPRADTASSETAVTEDVRDRLSMLGYSE